MEVRLHARWRLADPEVVDFAFAVLDQVVFLGVDEAGDVDLFTPQAGIRIAVEVAEHGSLGRIENFDGGGFGLEQHLLRRGDDAVGAVGEHDEDLVVFAGGELEALPFGVDAEITGGRVVGEFERLPGDVLLADDVEADDFGAPGVLFGVFVDQAAEVGDGGLHQRLELLLAFLDRPDDVVDFVAELVDVVERDAADGDLEQAVDVVFGHLADKKLAVGGHAVPDFGAHLFGRFGGFEALVDAVFDEDLLEGEPVPAVGEFLQLELELGPDLILEPLGEDLQNLGDGHLLRAIAVDDGEVRVDRHLALGVGVKLRLDLVGINAAGEVQHDLHLFSGAIFDRGDLELAALGGLLDGGDQRFGGGVEGHFPNGDRLFVLGDVDPGPHPHLAAAVVVFLGIHKAALLEVGEQGDLFAPQKVDLGLEQLPKIVRHDFGGHADGNTFGAEHEHHRHLGGQEDRLILTAIVGRLVGRELFVEQRFPRQRRQPTLDITGRRRRVAGEDIAVIPLPLDEIFLVGQNHQGLTDRSITMRVQLHRFADDVGDLMETPVIHLEKSIEDAPLHGFAAIPKVRNGTVQNDVTGVFEKIPLHQRINEAHAL